MYGSVRNAQDGPAAAVPANSCVDWEDATYDYEGLLVPWFKCISKGGAIAEYPVAQGWAEEDVIDFTITTGSAAIGPVLCSGTATSCIIALGADSNESRE